MQKIDWDYLRYRGDLRDRDELLETYRVADFLDTFEENRRRQEDTIRNHLMSEGIRLTPRLSPRVYGIFESACNNLGLDTSAEIFCLQAPSVNAVAILDVTETGTKSLIGLTSAALEQLEDAELASIIGHELGHFLFEHNRFNALKNFDPQNPALTVLPPFGETLFLRWQKKTEISADRAGLVASRDLKASLRSLMKAAFGLSERNVTLDVDALLAQVDEVRGKPELAAAAFASHPLLPVRLKALELFSRSEKARRCGIPVEGKLLSEDQLADEVDALMDLTRRHPTKPLHLAVMRAVAAGGLLVLSSDGDITDDEVKILIQILHRFFTDEPRKELEDLVGAPEKISRRLLEAVEEVKRLGDENDKTFIISRLADIALADGAPMDVEGAAIIGIAEQLDLPPRNAYGIIVGAAQTVGFRVDPSLNRTASLLREALHTGMGFMPQKSQGT